MKKVPQLVLALMLSFGSIQQVRAQSESPTPVSLTIPKEEVKGALQKRTAVFIDLPLPDSKKLKAKVNINKTDATGKQKIIGQIENVDDASFNLRVKGNSVEGHIVLKESKKAYHYFTKNQSTFVEEVDINKVLCIDYSKTAAPSAQSMSTPPPVAPSTLKLQSLPGAKGCIYLDFDGEYVTETVWSPSGYPINALPSGFTEAQIRETFDIVEEDFRPFNMNVTTDSNVFNSYPVNFRIKVIFTPTTTAAPGTGGVAWAWSFRETDDPCWVFNLTPKSAGETASHEVGHTLGLSHDGSHPNPSAPSGLGYYPGQGEWAPIMGSSYTKQVTHWSKGEYKNASNPEDDIATIAGFRNGIGFRSDDHGNTMGTATPFRANSSGVLLAENNHGVIEQANDVDYFTFNHPGGPIYINVEPADRHANLNIAGTLYNSAGTVVSYSNMTGLTAGFISGGPAGTYYLSVASVGSGVANENGYSNYGSLGFYTINGNISGTGTDLNAATFYTNCNYGGTASYPQYVGGFTSYDFPDAGIVNDDVSSVKVNPGYAVILYENDNFIGNSITLTADDDCLTDNGFDNKVSSIRIVRTGNLLPQVALSSPLNNAVIYTPANIVLHSSPSDVDGTISKVEFYNGTTKLGEATAAPYTYAWNSVAAGTYYLTAVVTDNSGGQTTSNINKITVSSYPAAATFYPDASYFGTPVSLAPGVYDSADLIAKGIGDNTIESVMVVNGYEVILFKESPARGEAKRLTGNTTSLTAAGFDNVVSSLVVRPVTANIAPIVEVDIPYDSTVLTSNNFQYVNAIAKDIDGHVAKVEFYDGTTLLTTAYYPDFSFGWYNLPAGTRTLTAKAYDNENAVTVSSPVTIFVQVPTCTAAAWATNTTYISGNEVEQGSIRYRANFWNYNQPPSSNNGPSGSGKPWTSLGTCNSKMGAFSQNVITSIYPNPTSGAFAVESETDGVAHIYNSYGEAVSTINLVQGRNELNLSVPKGIYIIKINNTSTKFMVE